MHGSVEECLKNQLQFKQQVGSTILKRQAEIHQ
jgi:hypothetical protein